MTKQSDLFGGETDVPEPFVATPAEEWRRAFVECYAKAVRAGRIEASPVDARQYAEQTWRGLYEAYGRERTAEQVAEDDIDSWNNEE